MISYDTIITQVVVLYILIAAGFYARKRGFTDEHINKGIADIVLNIGLPALLLNSFLLQYEHEMLQKAGQVFVASVVIHIALFAMAKIAFVGYADDKRNVLTYMGLFPNAGFMGLPFIYAIYGQTGVFYTAIFIIPYHILMWTFGLAIFMKVKDYRSSAKIILANPVLLSVFAGMILFVTQLPVPLVLSNSFSLLGAVTAPLAMMLIGDRMAMTEFRKIIYDKDVFYGSLVRLIIAPIITWLILNAFNLDPMIINICVAVQTLPVAVTVAVLPAKFNGDATLGAKCAVISHALSLLTIPSMMILLMVK